MARREDEPERGPIYSARDARGGEIILRSRRRRLVFLGGLVAFAILALIAAFFTPY